MTLYVRKNIDFFTLFMIFVQLVFLKFNGKEQIGNKLLLILCMVSLLRYFWHYAKNQGGMLIIGFLLLQIVANILLLGGTLDNVRSNIIMLTYPIACIMFLEHFCRRYSDDVIRYFKKGFWIVNGYFLINAVVLLIQLQGTGFMIGVNASGTGNPMYEDLIAGLLGYSGTHQLSLFMTFVILYNMAYWKYEVSDLNKTPLLIYLIACIIFCCYISIENYNQAFFFVLPIGIALFILSSGLDVNKLTVPWNTIFKYLLLSVILFLFIVFLYNSNEAVRVFIDDNLFDKMDMASSAMEMGLAANGSDERFAMILYGLDYLNGWELGRGIGNYFVCQGGAMGFRHFGQASMGTLICLMGIWFVLTLICYYTYQLTKIVYDRINFIGFAIFFIYFVFLFVYCQIAYDNIVALWSVFSLLPIKFVLEKKREVDGY